MIATATARIMYTGEKTNFRFEMRCARDVDVAVGLHSCSAKVFVDGEELLEGGGLISFQLLVVEGQLPSRPLGLVEQSLMRTP